MKNISKITELHKKEKRKLIGPKSTILGFICTHRVSEFIDKGTNKVALGLDLNIHFVYFGSNVSLHNNQDNLKKSFNVYKRKIIKIKKLCTDSLIHLKEGTGPFVNRAFLNDKNTNDGFGGTLHIHVEPGDPSNYCLFEISDCYKKRRHSGTPREMISYLTHLINFLNEVLSDLNLVELRIKKKVN